MSHSPPPPAPRGRTLLVVLLVAGVVAAAVGGALSATAHRTREQAAARVEHVSEILRALEEIEAGVARRETSYRGFLVTWNTLYLERGAPAPAAARRAVARLETAIRGDTERHRALARLRPLVDRKLVHMDEVIALATRGDSAAALALVRTRVGEQLSRELAALLDGTRAEERGRLAGFTRASREADGRLTVGLGVAGAGALLALLCGSLLVAGSAARTRAALAEADRERRRLSAVLAALPVGVAIADADGEVTSMTGSAAHRWPAGHAPTGRGPLEFVATIPAWSRDTGEPLAAGDWPLVETLRTGQASAREIEVRPEGSPSLVLHVAAAPIHDAEGRPAGAVATWSDLTERVALEEGLRQARKLEAVGQLAGGVAHDFNNLLTVISGNLEFVAEDLPPQHAVQADLGQIRTATDRARTLVRHLLAFSRRQPAELRPLELGALVRGAERMLRRVIGEEIVLAVHVDDADGEGLVVRADAAQLEQVLLNLAVNARDAMLRPEGDGAGGGTLGIELDRVTLSPAESRRWGVAEAGPYARLVVRDTGHGMDETTRARAFEPFFTTKGVGKGTGLGLATVHGIVTQAGGAIRVDSAPGEGATFTVLLPARDGERPAPVTGEHAAPALPRGRGTVLLVEDEAPVRATVCRILERQGYAVREARHGADALLVWREHRDAIDVVVTDLRMPELGGRALMERVHAEAPTLPVVFMSGYADDGLVPAEGDRQAFVAKPFTADALLGALARVWPAQGARIG